MENNTFGLIYSIKFDYNQVLDTTQKQNLFILDKTKNRLLKYSFDN